MSTARSSRRAVHALLILLVALAAAPALDAGDDERAMLEIAAGLRCPVCQNLSVADSTSEMARDMRALIRDELRAGKTPDEIRAYFVSKYGEWILLAPSARGIGLVAWILPGFATLVAAGGAAWVLRRWTRRAQSVAPAPVDEAWRRRLRRLVGADEPSEALTAEEARAVEALHEIEFDYRAGKLSERDLEDLRGLYESKAARSTTSPPETHRVARRRPSAGRVASMHQALHFWRWAAAAVFLLGVGVAVGVMLVGAVRPRDGGSLTGDTLTSTNTIGGDADGVEALVARGRDALQRDDFKTATASLSRALALDPDHPGAHAYLGFVLLRGGHTERALAEFERALARDPASAPALWGKGLVLDRALDRPADAVRAWQALLTLRLSGEDRARVESLLAQARGRLPASDRRGP